MSLDSLPGRDKGTLATFGIEANPDNLPPEGLSSRIFAAGIPASKFHLLHFEEGVFPTKKNSDPRFLGWNYFQEGEGVIGRIKDQTEAILTEPAGLLPKMFLKCLNQLRSTKGNRQVRVQVGVAFPKSVAMLRKLFERMGIDPTTHLEAGFLLESFLRAEKDGYIDFFSDTWTCNCLEWVLSLIKADGIHMMSDDDRALIALGKVLGLTQVATGADILFQNKERLAELEAKFQKLPYPVPVAYLSGIVKTGYQVGGKPAEYVDDFLLLLESAYAVIQQLQSQFPDSLFWKNFSVNFVRMPQNNHGNTLPVEVISDEADSFRDLVIDIRYPAYKLDSQIFQNRLIETLTSMIHKRELQNHVFLDKGDKISFIDQALMEGWYVFADAQRASGVPDIGTKIAQNEIVYQRSAEELFSNLKNAPERDEYAIAEIGVYDANGIPEMLKHLYDLIVLDEQDKEKLLARLKKTVFVCVDIAQRGIETCQEVLGRYPELTNLFREFRYIEGDILAEECHSQLNKWKSEFLFIRAINTLCAFPEPTYVMRGGQPYRIDYDTVASIDDIKQVVDDLYETPKNTKCLKYFIKMGEDYVEQPPLSTGIVQVKDIFTALMSAQVSPDKVNVFVSTLARITNIRPEAALLIWERVLQVLKKRRRYVSIDGDEKEEALSVAAHHPDPRLPFSLSKQAANYMSHLGPFLCSDTGSAWFASLFTDTTGQSVFSHERSCGPATKGTTAGFPVQLESVMRLLAQDGLEARVLPRGVSSKKPLPSTVSMIGVRHRKPTN